ncbi:hypothetical protein JOF56_005285 [Kibdelosporangium banguiense]|uniref:Uncharacterized protein n=1 Tax=Kibdelosporangium banguiense TaxID=1365924 RepID=A0ABS4TKG4_9PSEU|nr:hypothetical protein [Kibdelosporangium banguiense]
MLAEPKPNINKIKPGRMPMLNQRGAHRFQPSSAQPGERFPTPQLQRLIKQHSSLTVIISRPTIPDQPAKPMQINRLRVNRELIASRLPSDRHSLSGSQSTAKQSHTVLNRGARTTGKTPISPDPINQLINRDRMIRLNQQHHQHTPQLCITNRDRPIADMHLDITKQTELHRHPASSLRPGRPCLPGPINPLKHCPHAANVRAKPMQPCRRRETLICLGFRQAARDAVCSLIRPALLRDRRGSENRLARRERGH